MCCPARLEARFQQWVLSVWYPIKCLVGPLTQSKAYKRHEDDGCGSTLA